MTVAQSTTVNRGSRTLCDRCKRRQITHVVDNNCFCCRCYVELGNPPADWHPTCMTTYEKVYPDKPLPAHTHADVTRITCPQCGHDTAYGWHGGTYCTNLRCWSATPAPPQ